MSRKTRLEELLQTGGMPPRAALDLLVVLCDAMAGYPAVGPDVLRPDRIGFDSQGALQLERRGGRPATEHDTRFALGALLFHVLLGSPWDEAIPRRQAQLDEVRSQLEFWPDGGSVASLVEELLGPGGFSGVRTRIEALRQRAAGAALGDWLADAIITRSEGAVDRGRPQHVMSVDELTANIPVGALAQIKDLHAAPAPGAPLLQVTPAPTSPRPSAAFVASAAPKRGSAIPIVTAVLVGVAMLGVFVVTVIAGLWLMS